MSEEIPKKKRTVKAVQLTLEEKYANEQVKIAKNLKTKENFINTHLKTQDSEPEALSLKYRSLEALIRDAPDDEIVKISKILNVELEKRARPVEILLFMNSEDMFEPELFNELNRMAVEEYVKAKYSHLTPEEQKNLGIEGILALSVERTGIAEEIENKRLMEQRHLDKTGLTEAELDEFYKQVNEDSEYYQFREYFKITNENPHIIQALKNLAARGVYSSDVSLYTLNLPLGSRYIISEDESNGEYPTIVNQ